MWTLFIRLVGSVVSAPRMEPTMEPPALEHKKVADRAVSRGSPRTTFYIPVSYTHLTLPTILLV